MVEFRAAAARTTNVREQHYLADEGRPTSRPSRPTSELTVRPATGTLPRAGDRSFSRSPTVSVGEPAGADHGPAAPRRVARRGSGLGDRPRDPAPEHATAAAGLRSIKGRVGFGSQFGHALRARRWPRRR